VPEVKIGLTSFSMDEICAEAVKAAEDVFKSHGIVRPAVVVNLAWKEPSNGQTYAIGTAVPRRYRRMMADSLAQSATGAGG